MNDLATRGGTVDADVLSRAIWNQIEKLGADRSGVRAISALIREAVDMGAYEACPDAGFEVGQALERAEARLRAPAGAEISPGERL